MIIKISEITNKYTDLNDNLKLQCLHCFNQIFKKDIRTMNIIFTSADPVLNYGMTKELKPYFEIAEESKEVMTNAFLNLETLSNYINNENYNIN